MPVRDSSSDLLCFKTKTKTKTCGLRYDMYYTLSNCDNIINSCVEKALMFNTSLDLNRRKNDCPEVIYQWPGSGAQVSLEK